MSELKDKKDLCELDPFETRFDKAFPFEDAHSGLNKAEYAAIHLKVPESGTPWLDEMIECSRRDEFAKAYINSGRGNYFDDPFYWADKLLKASDKGVGKK